MQANHIILYFSPLKRGFEGFCITANTLCTSPFFKALPARFNRLMFAMQLVMLTVLATKLKEIMEILVC